MVNNNLISPEVCSDIILDLDDVVCDTAPLFKHHFDNHTNTCIDLPNWATYNFLDQYPALSHDTINEIMVNQYILQSAVPCHGAVDAVKSLYNAGYVIRIVSARGSHPDAFNVSEQWLKRHDVPYHSLSITKWQQAKSTVYNQFANEFAYMFDDNLDNIIDATHNNVIQPILINQPWNINAAVNKFTNNRSQSLYHFCKQYELI